MSFSYYDSQRVYRQGPVQNGFDQRRRSSSTSHSQPQAFPQQNYQPQVGGIEYEPHYAFDQSNDWAHNHVVSANFQTGGASQFDVTEIHEYTSSEREPPWDPAGRTQARTVDSNLQLCGSTPASYIPKTYTGTGTPASYIPKASTVTGAAYPSPVFKRPPLGPRQSYTSIPDSGYGSQATLVESIPGVTQAEVKGGVFLPVDPPKLVTAAPRRALSVKTDPNPIGSGPTKRRRSRSFHEKCQACGKELKNKSESIKHELQHTKPYRCNLDRCARKDGFATINDLERHKKSVHGASPRVGKKSVYYCQACPKPTPGSRAKPWPRLDNFKAHIRRKHPDTEIDQLIQASEYRKPCYAESQHDCSQYSASIPTNDLEYQQDLSSPVGNAISGHASQQQDMNILFGQNSAQQLAHVGMVDYPTHNMREPQIPFPMPQYSTGDSMSLLHYAAHQELGSPVDSMISPTTTRQSAPSIFLNDRALPQYDDMDVDIRQNQRPRTLSMPSPSVSHATVSSVVSSAVSSAVSSGCTEGEHPCPEPGCNKVKKRECDLRKHMKRHSRPYGCTFAKCTKRFGSRNDWKRHENSQHFLSEMWRCEIKRPKGDTRCGHLSHDQQQFTQHLANSHGFKNGTEEIKKQCRDMHLGREGHHHFWCGFCNKLIEQAEGIQPGAWDVRFKHIGDHFDKDNLNIDEWIDIEKNKKKKLIDHDERTKKTGSRQRVDDDSDLGEDGIPPVYGAQVGRARRMVNDDADADGVSDDDMYM